MNVVQTPPYRHPAYNPALLVLEDTNAESVQVQITDQRTGITYIREREFFNNVARFDLMPLLKKLFGPHTKTEYPNGIYVDTSMYVQYLIDTPVGDFFIATKAVRQFKASTDLSSQLGKLLTGFKRIIKYDGYELDVQCMCFEGDTFIYRGDTPITISPLTGDKIVRIPILNDYESIQISDEQNFEFLVSNSQEQITTNDNEEIYVVVRPVVASSKVIVETQCKPESPFYIRWLNRDGGYDYWMFNRQQVFNSNSKVVDVYTETVDDGQTSYDLEHVLGIEASEAVKVGAEHLTENDYDNISRVIYSPEIEWYNEQLDLWVPIKAESNSLDKNTNGSRYGIEITFTLPKPNTQF